MGRDERDVDARASTRSSGVLEGELEERADVRAATAATGLEVARRGRCELELERD